MAHGLVLISLSAKTVARLTHLTAIYRKPSRLDLAALAAAEQETCPLLTGDGHLRNAAEAEGIEVHGTLWIAERIVAAGIITVDDLRSAYENMRRSGRRLPWRDVERQLRKLTDMA